MRLKIWNIRTCLAAAVAMCVLAAGAFAGEMIVLKGPDIIQHLAGKSVRGTYADGTPFTETFWPDGKDTYWDPRGSSTGIWKVTEDKMCFEYDEATGLSNGCFSVLRIGANCFDFYAESQAPATGQRKGGPRYTARASADGAAETCPDQLQV